MQFGTVKVKRDINLFIAVSDGLAVQEIPFLLEDKIISLGGKFEKAPEPWGVSVHYAA